jgi:hypothetical protein
VANDMIERGFAALERFVSLPSREAVAAVLLAALDPEDEALVRVIVRGIARQRAGRDGDVDREITLYGAVHEHSARAAIAALRQTAQGDAASHE